MLRSPMPTIRYSNSSRSIARTHAGPASCCTIRPTAQRGQGSRPHRGCIHRIRQSETTTGWSVMTTAPLPPPRAYVLCSSRPDRQGALAHRWKNAGTHALLSVQSAIRLRSVHALDGRDERSYPAESRHTRGARAWPFPEAPQRVRGSGSQES